MSFPRCAAFGLRAISSPRNGMRWLIQGSAVALLSLPAMAQVVTIDSHGRPVNGTAGTVDRRYAQVQPTSVELSKLPLDPRSRADLIRTLTAEQGFAMRPLPKGHRGLTLEANGKLDPAGESYLNMVTADGMSAKPGDRVIITDLKFDHNKIIMMLNGGPDAKHRFLRHISIGADPNYTNPVVQDSGEDPTGARLTLVFKDHVPELTGAQVKALLAPLISFDVKTPIEAFTDPLPKPLKDAILQHHVLVGMNTDMVVFAVGRPDKKMHDMEGQMPIDIWIYGNPPEPVQFVRINGNRVICLEIAKVGEEPVIYTQDVVSAMMRTDGTPAVPADSHTRVIAMGDVDRDPDTQAPAPPPTLRDPGEKLPDDTDKAAARGAMRPVEFPKQTADDYPDATNLPRTPAPPDNAQPANAKPAAEAKNTPPDKSKNPTPAKTASDKTQADKSQSAPGPAPAPGSTQPD
jgi:hypothetical protein